jgi:serine/threonine-protein kinase
MEPEAALCVLKGSLLGLAAAHAARIVHRDYKPENVVVDRQGESRLVDFGVARHAGGDAATEGTPSYMAPEQWSGAPASPAADVYAATATFVECLSGAPPFSAPDLHALRAQHMHAPIPVDRVPHALRDLIARGLAKDPARRPADAAAFAADLDATAVAAYGEDWEARGRDRLGKYAALLLLLMPPLAAAVDGGSSVATTVLGLARTHVAVAAAALVVALGAGITGALAMTGARPFGHSAPAQAVLRVTDTASNGMPVGGAPEGGSSTPTANPTAGPTMSTIATSASATSSTATATASIPSGTSSASSSATTRNATWSSAVPPPVSTSSSSSSLASSSSTAPAPTPSATQVMSLYIKSLATNSKNPQELDAIVEIFTSGPGAVTLKLQFADGTTAGVMSRPDGAEQTRTLSGSTSYTIMASQVMTCGYPYWGLLASTSPGAANGTQYADTKGTC